MPRCVVAVVEGVAAVELRRQVASGELPWFERALASGAFVPLDCGPVPYEPSNLTTAFSGVGPGHHGCFSYWEVQTTAEVPRVLDARDVRAPRLWQWPELRGLRFAVVNVQLTHPPQPIEGCLISYPMRPTLHAAFPRDLLRSLARRGVRYAHDVSAFYTGQPTAEFAGLVHEIARRQLETIVSVGADCDVLVANLTLADRVSHFLWRDPEAPEADAPGAPSRHVRDAYRFLDGALARLETLLGEGGRMLVLSEIGFGPIRGFTSIDALLERACLLVRGADGEVDARRSVARESVQGSHGVNLLLESRPGGGGVRDADAERAADEVRAALLEPRHEDGTPILADARAREEVHPGPAVDLAPDLILFPADPERPPLGDPRWARRVHRSLQTGWHRSDGFCLVLPRDAARSAPGPRRLGSIAPSVARVLDRDVPRHCSEEPLAI